MIYFLEKRLEKVEQENCYQKYSIFSLTIFIIIEYLVFGFVVVGGGLTTILLFLFFALDMLLIQTIFAYLVFITLMYEKTKKNFQRVLRFMLFFTAFTLPLFFIIAYVMYIFR